MCKKFPKGEGSGWGEGEGAGVKGMAKRVSLGKGRSVRKRWGREKRRSMGRKDCSVSFKCRGLVLF